MDYSAYRNKYFVEPEPEPRFDFEGIFGATLFFQDYEDAVGFYERVLGPPAYIEGQNTKGWKVGATWLTLLRSRSGNPRNVEVRFEMDSPAEADRLQEAFIVAGGSGQPPRDDLMYTPVHLCPVKDPFGTEILITSQLIKQ